MIYSLVETAGFYDPDNWIATCKSNSNVAGTQLREAHHHLGFELAKTFWSELHCGVVVCFMRGGLPFSLGIADKLDCPILFYDDKNSPDFFERNADQLCGRRVILVDSVINSGKSMLKALEKLKDISSDIKIATNVLCYKAIERFNSLETFTVRVSGNSFEGSNVKEQCGNKGPDTGDRLFKTQGFNYL
ncbi:phosphoribosyltransferase family protein [uncultured Fibrobacter sp.]|uniref:phosphoribosyltransferase family protein n=1 Tax=uncultured Fibrobacter sp. TaxID=261512 RepID=UPI0025D7722A|nr:phosphoribosyltransferase family protein [uncultured Fibrobacter sp.]